MTRPIPPLFPRRAAIAARDRARMEIAAIRAVIAARDGDCADRARACAVIARAQRAGLSPSRAYALRCRAYGDPLNARDRRLARASRWAIVDMEIAPGYAVRYGRFWGDWG